MFSKFGGTTIFSTINLRSGYYHIGLTRESRAKSAFVVPMGKWQFKHTPFRLSQAPAYFQLLIDKVLMAVAVLRWYTWMILSSSVRPKKNIYNIWRKSLSGYASSD